MVGVYEIDNYG